MTSRERLTAVFERRIPDKVPVAPRLDPKWLQNAGPALADRIIRTTDIVLYLDLLPDVGLFLGQEAQERLRTETRGDLRTETLDTPKGPLTRVVRIEADMMDWAERHFFETADDLEKALAIPYAPARVDLAEYRRWDARVGEDGVVLAHVADALCCPGLWFSPEQFVVSACAESTDRVLELMARVNRSILDVTAACLAGGVRWFMQSGAELASQTLLGPEWFGRLVTPFDGPVAQTIRRAGGYTWCHCHGKISRVHRDLAALGAHVLSPCEQPPQGDISLADLKRSIGAEIALAGTLDDLALLASGDRPRIRAEALACIEAGMPGGGFLLGGTEGCVFSLANAESYLYLCELRDRFGRYE